MVISENAEVLAGFANFSKQGRGRSIYSFTQLMSFVGRKKDGSMSQVQTERPYFDLSIEDRIDIFRKCDMVLGVVTSRMNRISSTPWTIVPKKKIMDRIEYRLKTLKELYNEYSPRPELRYKVAAGAIAMRLQKELPDVLPDLSNFDNSMLRWKRAADFASSDKVNEIEDWLSKPNINDDWTDYAKKYVMDAMVHGAAATYKQVEQGVVENFYMLPGGTVYPLKGPYVTSSVDGFLQVTNAMDIQVMYGDECSFTNYIPTSARSYGFVPLEALVNKVAEALLFDALMAQQADGTKPPEKMVVFGEKSPFGDLESAFDLPMDGDEQKRLETILNEPRKTAVRSLTGYGTPVILDLSRENTMAVQNERQKMLRECVAQVFNMSNMEVNLSGAGDTSGRSTSEEQGEIDYMKGSYPLMAMLDRTVNQDLLPYRYGTRYEFEWKSGANEMKELEKQRLQLEVGYSINELREARGQQKYAGAEYDAPPSQGQAQQSEQVAKMLFAHMKKGGLVAK